MTPGRSLETLHQGIKVVFAAHTIDEALDALIATIQGPPGIWQASIAVLTPTGTIKFVASWAAGDTMLEVGTEVALWLTEDLNKLAGQWRRGVPLTFNIEDVDIGLLGFVSASEGVVTWMMIGLEDAAGAVVGVLSLGTATHNGFDSDDVHFFTGLGRGLESKLLELIARSDR